MNPLSIQDIKKSYAAIEAVRGVSFEVKSGEIFGLIGPDGAGKTTIIRSVVSLLNVDGGEIFFKGLKVRDHSKLVRANIGYMPQRFSLYRDLTVEENLRFFGDLFKIPVKVQSRLMDKLYKFSKLGPFRNRRAEALSGGMKQKLALSCMLMHEPEVIVLDEPTFGVDPVSRSEFWDILKSLANQGTSILISTAYMDEALLCDRVALIFEGKILVMDSPHKLLDSFREPLYLVETDEAHRVYEKIQSAGVCGRCTLFGNGVHITDIEHLGAEKIAQSLKGLGISYKSLKRIKPDLEDLFLLLIRESYVPQV